MSNFQTPTKVTLASDGFHEQPRHQVQNHQHNLNSKANLPKMSRKSKVTEPDVIHLLDEILELRVVKVIQNGERKRSNVYLIDCRRQVRQSVKAPAEQSSTCVLKTVSYRKSCCRLS